MAKNYWESQPTFKINLHFLKPRYVLRKQENGKHKLPFLSVHDEAQLSTYFVGGEETRLEFLPFLPFSSMRALALLLMWIYVAWGKTLDDSTPRGVGFNSRCVCGAKELSVFILLVRYSGKWTAIARRSQLHWKGRQILKVGQSRNLFKLLYNCSSYLSLLLKKYILSKKNDWTGNTGLQIETYSLWS